MCAMFLDFTWFHVLFYSPQIHWTPITTEFHAFPAASAAAKSWPQCSRPSRNRFRAYGSFRVNKMARRRVSDVSAWWRLCQSSKIVVLNNFIVNWCWKSCRKPCSITLKRLRTFFSSHVTGQPYSCHRSEKSREVLVTQHQLIDTQLSWKLHKKHKRKYFIYTQRKCNNVFPQTPEVYSCRNRKNTLS